MMCDDYDYDMCYDCYYDDDLLDDSMIGMMITKCDDDDELMISISPFRDIQYTH